jgi:hypothetical protein
MKKNERLETWLDEWDVEKNSLLPREYRAYFHCFNAGDFYDAHDVLEHLWLRCEDENRSFYQALIQFAGAFVHLQKHALFPDHPTHSRRLSPGARLFALADARFADYPKLHLQLNLLEVRALCALWSERALQPETDPELARESPLIAFAPPQLKLS